MQHALSRRASVLPHGHGSSCAGTGSKHPQPAVSQSSAAAKLHGIAERHCPLSRKRTLSVQPARPTSTRAGLPADLALPALHSTATFSLHNCCHLAAFAVVVGACVRNIPQLITCWRTKSTEGISLASLVTEITCYAAVIAYGVRSVYPATVWGSEVACWFQDAALFSMISYLRKKPLLPMLGFAATWLFAQHLLFTPAIPLWMLGHFQVIVALVLGLGARVPQIVLNTKRGHTGSLAPATSIFNATANCVTFCVTAVLTGDPYIMGMQLWMLVLNVTILSQIFGSRRRAALAPKPAKRGSVERVAYTEEKRRRRIGYA